MWRMPNLPSPESPVGADDSENVVRRRVGEPTKFDFTPRDHVELMELNGWSEMERITKVCGSRTYAITGELARLELAIHLLVMDKLAENGFRVITVPSLSKETNFMPLGWKGRNILGSQIISTGAAGCSVSVMATLVMCPLPVAARLPYRVTWNAAASGCLSRNI